MAKLVSTESNIVNAKITGTQLGSKDCPCFTCYLHLEGDGWGCSFGGYSLDSYSKENGERIGTAEGFNAIIELMKTLEVSRWEDLKGQYIRCETNGWGGRITKVGHLLKDKWFSFEEFFEKEKECTR